MNYEVFTANSKTEKLLKKYIANNSKIKNKIDRLRKNPRKEIGAHPLHGKLKGKFACWFASNIRAITPATVGAAADVPLKLLT